MAFEPLQSAGDRQIPAGDQKGTRFSLRRRILLTALLLLVMMPSTVVAQQARLTDMVLSNNRDSLLLFVKVEGAFTEKMKQAILNGIPTTFSFFIILERTHTLWPDSTVADRKVTHTIKYESLKNQFVVKRSWEDNRPLTTDSFEEASKWMSEVKSFPVVPLKSLDAGKSYRLSAKAELDTVELPFYLNYIFFFVSMWDFETNWNTIEFVH